MAYARRHLGLTIVELLVVIAVIVLLAAILFPVLLRSRMEAKNSSAQTRMRDLAWANELYNEDHDRRYVPIGAPKIDYSWSPARNPKVDAAGVPWHGWGLGLRPYVKSAETFQSPLIPDNPSFTGACSNSSGMKVTNAFTLNWLLHRDGSYSAPDDPGYDRSPDGTVLNTPIRESEIVQPNKTIAILPTTVLPPYGSEWGCLFLTLESGDFTNRILFRGEFGDSGNVVFADNHVQWLKSRMTDPNTHPTVMIYHWPSRGMWMQPTMPDNTMGYQNTDGIR